MSAEQFGKALVASGLFTSDDVKALWASFAAADRPADGPAFAQRLVALGKLTQFQADEILAGRGKRLIMGEYSLVAAIGEGGMGQVFKAMHRRMERIVALKVMSPAAMRDPGNVKRFQREVEAAARLTHDNIVAAYDAGQAADVHFLVMQFVDGCDLATIVKRDGPLPIEKAVDYIVQAAEGLAYAHAEGIVHRDIKPANLLVNSKGVVKILDMGLARIDDGGDGLTATEQVMGTVDYMSPEQASHTKDADARSDIYSLGCTLWFLLTARKLYDGSTMIARLMQHRSDPLPSLVKTRDDAPWPLEQALHKMIAKRPSERHQTMEEVIEALRPFGGAKAGGASRGGGGSSTAPSAEMASFLRALDTGAGRTTAAAANPSTATDLGATVAFQRETETDSQISKPYAGGPVGGKGSASSSRLKIPTKSRNRFAIAGAAVAAIIVTVGLALAFKSDPEPLPANEGAHDGELASAGDTVETGSAEAAAEPPAIAPYELLTSAKYLWTTPANLGPAINSKSSERAPCLSGDGREFYFASNRTLGGDDFDLWFTMRPHINARWEPARPLGGQFNTAVCEEHPTLSADGLTLLFARGETNGPGDIYMSTRPAVGAEWSDPIPLPGPINSPQGREAAPELSADGLTLLFHSDRPGSLGRRDLYQSRRATTADPFGEPESLGRLVNSTFDEEHPTMSADGLVLVFGSNRAFGAPSSSVGAWDLWMSTRPDTQAEWTAPIKLPAPVNGPSDDNNPTFAAGGAILLFRSSRQSSPNGDDLFVTYRAVDDGKRAPLLPLEKDGHRYLFVPDTLSWEQARDAAAARGGHLVTLETKAEDVWVRLNFVERLNRGRMFWIGAHRDPADGQWSWLGGAPLGDVNWGAGEGGALHENVAAYIYGDEGYAVWADFARDRVPIAGSGLAQGQNRCVGYLIEWDSLAAPLEPDRAVSFSTRHNGVRVPNWAYDGKSPLTIEAYVRLDKEPPPSYVIMGDPQVGGLAIGALSGQLGFRFYGDRQGNTAAQAASPLVVGRTAHLAGVFDGAELRFYVDGKLQASNTQLKAWVPSQGKFYIGADTNGDGSFSTPFAGAIDEVRISSAVRYTKDFSPAKRFEPDDATIALYHFDEGMGLTAQDASATGRHASLYNPDWVEGLNAAGAQDDAAAASTTQ